MANASDNNVFDDHFDFLVAWQGGDCPLCDEVLNDDVVLCVTKDGGLASGPKVVHCSCAMSRGDLVFCETCVEYFSPRVFMTKHLH